MLTKTLKFDTDVLSVLRAMRWENDGTLGIITGGQLDRKLYEKLNKALDAMGGKWNRKAGGHVFSDDPRAAVEGLLDNGALTIERDGFFETPNAVIDRMFELVSPRGYVLEPSAGMGAIVKRLLQCDEVDTVTIIEKNQKRAEYLKNTFTWHGVNCVHNGDFLAVTPDTFATKFDTIFANPPFEEGQDIDHVRHMYTLLDTGGKMVSVMGEGAFFRNDGKATAFRDWLRSVGYWSEQLPQGSFKESGTGVNTRLVVIDK